MAAFLPEVIIDRLIEGYRRFRADVWPAERARYEALSEFGQHPETLVIACSDSRVDPAKVFNAAPGEMFIIRNVAGLVPVYLPDSNYHGTSAALEFAVRVLRVARIVVLGHAQCGGVRAMVEGAPAEAQDFVAPWMSMAESVLQRLPSEAGAEERLDLCEVEVVRLSLDNLMTFPWVAEAVAAGRLKLEGYRFAIHTGVLARVSPEGLIPVG